jgi:hypothetical protein
MSNHAARPRSKKLIYFGFERDNLAALILGLGIGLSLLIAHLWAKDSRQDWPSVMGHVIETRIGVVTLIEQKYQPSQIVYQVEAHVAYERNGTKYNAWLPVSKQSTDKAFLEFWLSQKKARYAQFNGRLAIPHIQKQFFTKEETLGAPSFAKQRVG